MEMKIKLFFLALLLLPVVSIKAGSNNCEYRNGLRVLSVCFNFDGDSLQPPFEQLFAEFDTIVVVVDVDEYGYIVDVPVDENIPCMIDAVWKMKERDFRFENCNCDTVQHNNVFLDVKPNTTKTHHTVSAAYGGYRYETRVDSDFVYISTSLPSIDMWPPKRYRVFPGITRINVKVFDFRLESYEDVKWLLSVAFEK